MFFGGQAFVLTFLGSTDNPDFTSVVHDFKGLSVQGQAVTEQPYAAPLCDSQAMYGIQRTKVAEISATFGVFDEL